jgi:hypothetical protein
MYLRKRVLKTAVEDKEQHKKLVHLAKEVDHHAKSAKKAR